MSKSISSRRAKAQARKAQRQVVLAVIGTIVLLAFFLFVLMPFVFRFALSLARSENPFVLEPSDTIPPQQPALTPPEPFLNSSQFELTGYTEAAAEVFLIVNGEEQASTAADDSGQFSFDVSLEEGEYELWLYARDAADNESALTTRYPVVIDTTKPDLQLETPEDGAVFTLRREKTMEVKGKLSEQGTVYVNASRVTTGEEGDFFTQIQLGEGENELIVQGQDQAGNQSVEVKRTVEYRP